MERKFMIYQRRDGLQIAEEATGIRLENGMEFLARPNKSALWCTADFGIDLHDEDDGYELVGEEFIDCSHLPTQILRFVDGVMKVINQSRVNVENMIEEYDDAINDRDLIVASQWKADINAAIELCHEEALKMKAAMAAPFCPVADCTECEIKPCPFDRQRSEQLTRQQHRDQLTAGLEALYAQQRSAMEHTEELLRMVRIHD